MSEPMSVSAPAEVRRVDVSALSTLQDLHARVFAPPDIADVGRRGYRVLHRWDRRDLRVLIAYERTDSAEPVPVGFKVGYGRSEELFYSARGGVLPAYRRRGIGRQLLHEMMRRARTAGYRRCAFHTLPDRHPGMAEMARSEGFRLVGSGYHPAYEDHILRFEKTLTPRSDSSRSHT
mgnify:CR=1 FL=1